MRNAQFSAIRSEGGLLTADLLQRIAAGEAKRLEGLRSADYHLDEGVQLRERISSAWSRMTALWSAFRAQRDALPDHDLGITLTRQKWLLPLFDELGFGRLTQGRPRELEGRTYAIYTSWTHVPLHLVGCKIDLDRRMPGVAGAAGASPHALVQETLNRDQGCLWGMVSNGRQVRLLRDSTRLTRQSYLEFDLEAIMEGESYPDFALLWMICHQSRFEGARPEDCWLERWRKTADEEGTRALEALRRGVERAIEALGRGFLAHPANQPLRQALQEGSLRTDHFYRCLLRLVYRLIFLFVTEERGLLFDPASKRADRERYLKFYSARRLRNLALYRRPGRHADLYAGLRVVMDKLDDELGCPALGLAPLGGALWDRQAIGRLAQSDLANADLLDAVRALCWFEQEGALRPVRYSELGSEELGSVYESLLELHPEVRADAAAFELKVAAGTERKTSGSYYTPTSLVDALLDSALEPVAKEAVDKALNGRPLAQPEARADAERALLDLKVCDPACGSGHFLVVAAHRLARRLAQLRAGGEEPGPEACRAALREVIGRCLYGVDLNPMAVELCKFFLWLEGVEPGKPLSFLDHHIRCGNSLLGATPELIEAGLPEGAFAPLAGDDKKIASALRKANARELHGQAGFGQTAGLPLEEMGRFYRQMEFEEDGMLAALRNKARRFDRWETSEEVARARLVADAWCAAFAWKKTQAAPPAVTTDTLRCLSADPATIPEPTRREIARLAAAFRFFHWHLAFPSVFSRGEASGFDVVLGNPPWERVKLQEKEWFASRVPAIANARNRAERQRLIERLPASNPEIWTGFQEAVREAEVQSQFLRASGKNPLGGRGDVNTYTVFAELKRQLIGRQGRVGCLIPSGIATDDTTKFFFQNVVETNALISLFDFENKNLFPAVHSSYKFCLFTCGAGSPGPPRPAEFVFFAHSVDDLADPDRRFTLSAEEIALLNPNTRTCPIFRSRRDAELTKAIYRRVPILLREAQADQPEQNPWGIKFSTMFHMSNDSHLFRTREELESAGATLHGNQFHVPAPTTIHNKPIQQGLYLPLYEAKMIHHYDHRWATYDGDETRDLTLAEKQDPHFLVLPRYWVQQTEVDREIQSANWDLDWLIGFRNVTNTTNERTAVNSILSRVGVGHSLPLIILEKDNTQTEKAIFLSSSFSSFSCDYLVRQKLGGTNFTFGYFSQIAVPLPIEFKNRVLWSTEKVTLEKWLSPRFLELVFSAWDMAPFGRNAGLSRSPLKWLEKRRFVFRCEIDAAFFHLYLPADAQGQWKLADRETIEELALLRKFFQIPRDAVSYIMDTFPIVKRKDEEKFGEYRTKRTILEIYDAMQTAIRTGIPYQTPLDPPPADPRCTHPPREDRP